MAASPTPTQGEPGRIEGYDRVAIPDLITRLRECSQAELAEIDTYERAHAARRPVLDKLRYLRGDQPIEGYDDLPADEVVGRLDESDLATLHAVRGYESRLRHRDDVLAGVNDLRRRRVRADRGDTGAPPPPPPPFRELGVLHRVVATVGVTGLIILLAVLGFVSLFVIALIAVSIFAPGVVG